MARMKLNYITMGATPSYSLVGPVLNSLLAFSLVFPATTPWIRKHSSSHFTDKGSNT